MQSGDNHSVDSVSKYETNGGLRSRIKSTKKERVGGDESEVLLDGTSGVGSADIEAVVGIVRTFCWSVLCLLKREGLFIPNHTSGGWVYITSRDHHGESKYTIFLQNGPVNSIIDCSQICTIYA